MKNDIVSSLLVLSSIVPYLGKTQNNTDKQKAAIESYRTGGIHFMTSKDTTILKVGDEIPDFYTVDTTKKNVHWSELKGNYVIIDIWASWCTWCIKEAPFVDQMKEVLKGKKIQFVSLSCDEMVPNWYGAIGNYHLQKATQWLIVDKAFMKAFKVDKIPRFILLDPEGKVYNLDMPRPSKEGTLEYLKSLKGI